MIVYGDRLMRKSAANDTLLRHWEMLRMLPRWPRKVSTTKLHQQLKEKGYVVSLRCVQRDLDKLSTPFQIYSDENRPRGWCWAKDAIQIDVPAMEPNTALTLRILADYAQRFLPHSTLDYLKPHMDKAEQVLDKLSHLSVARWPDKLRVIHLGPQIDPPSVQSEVLETVYIALLEEYRFSGKYRSRSKQEYKTLLVNPLGLVFKDRICYLVATLQDYNDVRHLALHRFESAKLESVRSMVPEGFTLDGHIEQGAFGYPFDKTPVRVSMRMSSHVARSVAETPISSDQHLEEISPGIFHFSGTILDSSELRWWILSNGDGIEVLEPESLRMTIGEIVNKMHSFYKNTSVAN